MNHFLCISDEALIFGCQKRNGLVGEVLPSWTPVIVLLSLVLLDMGAITNLFQQGLQQTISDKIPGLNELYIALLYLVLEGGKNISLKTNGKLMLAI